MTDRPTRLLPRRRLIGALGAAAALAGCASLPGARQPTAAYRLGGDGAVEAAEIDARPQRRRPTVAVERPLATGAMASDRVVVDVGGELQFVSGARWEDEMPDILAFRIGEALQASGAVDVVDSAQRAGRAQYALVGVLRKMQVALRGDASGEAQTEIAARLVTLPDRDVVATRVVGGTAPAANDAPATLTDAINRATDRAMADLAAWVAAETGRAGTS